MEDIEIFGPKGLISQSLPGYEFRRQQLEMAQAVKEAIEQNKHLIVEAPTGVGKSFAYLVPIVFSVGQNISEPGDAASETLVDEEKADFDGDEEEYSGHLLKGKVVISTNTISLQEQLVTKDIPFLKRILPLKFKVVLVKGRSNYLCLRRLEYTNQIQKDLFENERQVEEYERIKIWASFTRDGSLSDLPFAPAPKIWDEVCSDRDNCRGKHCPFYNHCFFQKARRQMYRANLLIVNHHLFFSDLALRTSGQSLLPPYKIVVLDEAHTIEDVATRHLGLEISNFKVKYLLDKLYNDTSQKGFLVHLKDTRSMRLVNLVRAEAQEFFSSIESATGQEKIKRIFKPGLFENNLHKALKELYESLKESRSMVQTKEEEMDLSSYMKRILELDTALEAFLQQRLSGYVYWIEISQKRRTRIILCAAPVNVGSLLQNYLFGEMDSVIMTSATISTNNSFDYFKKRLGITEAEELIVTSPFDYGRQVKLYIPAEAPDPNDTPKYTEYIINQVKKYIQMTQGKAFVLFTSYRLMNAVHERIYSEIERLGLSVFKQGGELSRTQMLEKFRADINSVLFGTDSFWQGVDVAGPALSNVIITRLPFSVPDHPVIEARMEEIAERGGDPFLEYTLPGAIIKFKQGFGRLIRHKNDQGIVVILDNRILTKSYGRKFLNSLPQCQLIIE